MKKKTVWISVVLLMFLCACNTEDTGKEVPSPTPTEEAAKIVTPTNTPSPSPTPTKDEDVIAYLNSFDKIDCTDIDSYVNKEDSIRNSNLLNYGFLTYDSEGNIYYVNENDSKIYRSDGKGENKQLICENVNAWGWLQLKGEWLYYLGHDTSINRVNIISGEEEQLFGERSGAFTIDGEKLYFDDRNNGFVAVDLDGKNKEVVFDSRNYLNLVTGGENLWIGEVYGVSRDTLLWRYLIKIEGDKVEVLNQRGYFPLLAGNYLSFVNRKTAERHIYNLKTDKDTNLEVETEKTIVSDGGNFYYPKIGYKNKKLSADIYCWNGVNSERVMVIDDVSWVYHMFLTPDKLYCQPHVEVDGKQVTQLWYYDLETGETGQVY